MSQGNAPPCSCLRNLRLEARLRSVRRLIALGHLGLFTSTHVLRPLGLALGRRFTRSQTIADSLILFAAAASSSFDHSMSARRIVRLCRGAGPARAGSAFLF